MWWFNFMTIVNGSSLAPWDIVSVEAADNTYTHLLDDSDDDYDDVSDDGFPNERKQTELSDTAETHADTNTRLDR